MNLLRRMCAIAVSAAAFTSTANAAELGTRIDSSSWATDMGGGAGYYHNVFDSGSATVGKQTENYVEYSPNSESVPIVVNGASVWGKRTILSASDYMLNNSMRPLIGINADFFSFNTGIPMGYTVVNGEILSKENNMQDAAGFRKDGSAFIDKIGISASLTHDNEKIEVRYINKWLQKGFDCVNLLTDDFAATTHTDFKALYVTCSADSGDLSLNTSMALNVDEVYVYDGAIKIPEGKYVFVMDVNGNQDCYNVLSQLLPGDKISFTNSVWGAECYDWAEADYIVSTIGGRLLNNGVEGSGFEKGIAPRTAFGIKEDGTEIFYTLDGRQNGYSYGCKIETLAKRMKELGCVDAINFDGGGSTAIGAVFPGSDKFTVRNKPSEGTLRSCANYIFLQDRREKTDIPWYVEWQIPSSYNYLSGTVLQMQAKSVYDTGNYKMDGLKNVQWSAENSGNAQTEVDENGYISFKGDGDTVVTVSSASYKKSFNFYVCQNPDNIVVKDTATGKEINEISVYSGEMKNITLEAQAYKNSERLVSAPGLFSWIAQGSAADVDENGVVSINGGQGGTAVITVSAGGTQKKIPVNIIKPDSFADINGHWAHDVITDMAQNGIINGIEEDGGLYFKPDSNISRIQFAAIICNALGINPNDYSGVKLDYTDTSGIQPWAMNYIKAMSAKGYITGRSDDDGKTQYLDPESSITRAEAFTVMSRAIDNTDEGMLTYADKADIPSWALDAFRTLSAAGIIEGFEDNTIKPGGKTTRAEAAAMVSKMLSAK